MPDVCKVQGNRFPDVDFLAGNAQGAHQFPGIVVGAVGGAKAGHGHAVHIRGRSSQLAHGLHRHQQGQRGVKAAGNADDSVGIADDCQPLFQARNLHLENLHTALDSILPLGGHKGQLFQRIQRAVGTEQAFPDRYDLCIRAVPGSGVGIASVSAAVCPDFAKVAVLHQQVIRGNGFLCFRQQPAVFRDQALAGEDEILSGFGGTGGTVGIDAVQRSGLVGHQIPAVDPLADGLIGGGQIHDDLGAA